MLRQQDIRESQDIIDNLRRALHLGARATEGVIREVGRQEQRGGPDDEFHALP